ncbi:MAG: tripartite tricarboxylate transporter substrate binding protein [Burkholderiaceae bacterium]|nr:tripartite tricarboxylate transporter substrate binding protein [Rhodoferax sp.]MCB2041528.1 tripartite tricarboxylate transporter substrate binding protein [Rhodoferax sp.]MCP5262626.1 tripartite tricarboxylate transporter substrate binding protein [Rhodoferax sp.]MCW5641610.1 tripartite tricarboxylate transporter substrate binding protein [Rhodoferax sp.]
MKRHFLKQTLRLAAVCAGLAMSTGPAAAQTPPAWPERSVRLVVPFAPGAGTDAMGRLVAQKLGEELGAHFVVENRAGASGAIGTQHVAQQPADGYTLLLVASPFTTVAASLPSAGYDPLRQFVPVGMIATGPLVWATNQKLPANNMRELVALAKRRPGVLNYGSAGAGGVNHLVLELLKARTGTFITHIPYRGVAPATLDMLSDQVQLVTGTIPALLPFIRDGRVRPLAVTSAKRSPALPDVPSMAESGLAGIDVVNYFAIMAPAGTPAGVVDKLNAAINRIVAMPDVVARFRNDAVDPAPGSPALLGAFIEADYRAWRNVVTTQKLVIE